ncbi:MAG TPA: response regulator [Pirellulales bacterium]|nr:response regulator [Pirellulales bacterium]
MTRETVGRMMEILLVEDSLVDASATMGALRHAHVKHRLTLVRDGDEANEFLHRQGKFASAPQPDLILLDLHLPKKDGLELLAEMRSDFRLRDIPVVVLTASADEVDRNRSATLQVEHYMLKPVNVDKFVAVVRELKNCWFTELVLAAAEQHHCAAADK